MNDFDQLLPGLRAGERSALVALRALAEPILRHAIKRYIQREEDVEELLADTLIRAHRKIESFRGDCSLRTWLYRIAENLAKNRHAYWTRRRRDQTISLDYTTEEDGRPLHEELPADAIDHRLELETEEIERAFRATLPLLNRPQREVLGLLIDERLPYDEISRRLRIGIGTVKSRIGRARGELRRLMNEKLEAA